MRLTKEREKLIKDRATQNTRKIQSENLVQSDKLDQTLSRQKSKPREESKEISPTKGQDNPDRQAWGQLKRRHPDTKEETKIEIIEESATLHTVNRRRRKTQ